MWMKSDVVHHTEEARVKIVQSPIRTGSVVRYEQQATSNTRFDVSRGEDGSGMHWNFSML